MSVSPAADRALRARPASTGRPDAQRSASQQWAAGWGICHADRGVQYALPAEVARSRQAVIVAEEAGVLWIAVAQPDEPGLAAALAAAARRPVRLLAAGPEELGLALAACYQPQTLAGLRRERLRSLIEQLGLAYLLDAEARALLDTPAPVAPDDAVAVVAWRLPGVWGPELIGLLEGLPHLALTAAQIPLPLRLLLPPNLRGAEAGRTMTPLCLEGGSLVLACGALPAEALLASITAWTGLPVRCVLCDPALLRELTARPHQPDATPRSPRPGQQPWEAGLDAAERRHILALARQTGVSPEVALRSLHGRSATPTTVALPRPAQAALALLPAQLARSLTVLPLRLDADHLEVALAGDEPEAEDLIAAISLLTGRTIRARRTPAPLLRAALVRAYGLARPAFAGEAGDPFSAATRPEWAAARAPAGGMIRRPPSRAGPRSVWSSMLPLRRSPRSCRSMR